MPSLPIFQDQNKNLMLMQTQWKSAITPTITNPINQGQLITDIKLINGVTVVNHKLGRQMVGWMQTDIDAPAAYYRSKPFNSTTLTLTSNAAATLSLWVF
jgi:hypothetical protein